MWKIGEFVGDTEGRMDVCVAAAGVLKTHTDCLEYPAAQFREVRRVLLRVSRVGSSHSIIPLPAVRPLIHPRI